MKKVWEGKMENFVPEFKIGLTQEAVTHLGQIRKWTMFFSVLGFIGLGIMIIMGIAMTFVMSMLDSEEALGPVSGIILAIVFIIIAVIYFFPYLYLYRFSVHTKSSLAHADSNDLAYALKNLNSHFTFFGVLTLIVLGIYAVALVVWLLILLLS